MPVWKRIFDIVLGLLLAVLFTPFFIGVLIWMTVKRDFPALYISERMQTPSSPFRLVKFRSMRPPREGEPNTGVSGGDKEDRITPFGRKLRSARLDEVPQLWNVLRGEMSFVGPRPPLRRYTDMFPDLYERVLTTRPGITGLASIIFYKTEARLLVNATTPEETEAIYVARCIPRKARLDLIYLRNRSIGLDFYILYLTAAKIVPLPGRRARRVR